MKRVRLSFIVVLGASAGAIAAPDPWAAPPASPPAVHVAGDVPTEPAAPFAALVRGDAASFASEVASPLLVQDLWFDTKPCQAFIDRQH